MPKTPLLAALLFLLFAPVPSRAQDKFEIFGGYSYLYSADSIMGQSTCTGAVCPAQTANVHSNLNGWEGSISYRLFAPVSLTADFTGNYGSLSSSFGSPRLHRQMVLFGPTFALHGRISPFVHFLFGFSHESLGAGSFTVSGTSYLFPSTSGNSFAFAFGGGLDIRLVPHVRLRAIQVDYVGTTAYSTTQNQARASAGLVFHF
jgi:opacity protein-like surface antigen